MSGSQRTATVGSMGTHPSDQRGPVPAEIHRLRPECFRATVGNEWAGDHPSSVAAIGAVCAKAAADRIRVVLLIVSPTGKRYMAISPDGDARPASPPADIIFAGQEAVSTSGGYDLHVSSQGAEQTRIWVEGILAGSDDPAEPEVEKQSASVLKSWFRRTPRA